MQLTGQDPKDYGLMHACNLTSIDDLILAVNSDTINRSILQLRINPEQVLEETGWNMEVPRPILDTFLYSK